MNKQQYIITDQEVELLEKYEGTLTSRKDPERYDGFDAEALASFCRMKDKSNDIFARRYQAARDVIDQIAEAVGIDPENTGFWLYTPDIDGRSPIVDKLESFFSRSGEKAKLKKRVDELEQENALLRSLLLQK